MGAWRSRGERGLTRRSLVVGGFAMSAMLASCKRGDDEAGLLASAARGSDRQNFLDAVGWTEFDGLTAVLAFVPYQMTDEQRRSVVENKSVFPTLPSGEPLLELRLEIKPGRGKEDLRINASTLRSVQLTFWYFDEPAPVIRIAHEEWRSTEDFQLVGLDGEMKRGGYVLGTLRGKQLYKNPRNVDEAYLWNVRFAQSLV